MNDLIKDFTDEQKKDMYQAERQIFKAYINTSVDQGDKFLRKHTLTDDQVDLMATTFKYVTAMMIIDYCIKSYPKAEQQNASEMFVDDIRRLMNTSDKELYEKIDTVAHIPSERDLDIVAVSMQHVIDSVRIIINTETKSKMKDRLETFLNELQKNIRTDFMELDREIKTALKQHKGE
jgi:hypothetical protein